VISKYNFNLNLVYQACSWNETSITWANKPLLGPLLTSTVVFNSAEDREWGITKAPYFSLNSNITPNKPAYYEWDVTAHVQALQKEHVHSASFAFLVPPPSKWLTEFNSLQSDQCKPQLSIVGTNQKHTSIGSTDDATVVNGNGNIQ